MSTDQLTAAEFKAIGERAKEQPEGQCGRDRLRLYAAIEAMIREDHDAKPFFAIRVPARLLHRTKDAALEALLGGGK